MKIHTLLLLSFLTLALISCQSHKKGTFWGETDYYKDFLFKKYEPVKMEQTLEFDFNDDAKKLLNHDIKFEVVEKDQDGKFKKADDFDLYKNGKICADNILVIQPSEEEAKICLVFKPDAREGSHTLYLRETGNSGLDRIDYLELADGFVVKKDDITNPLESSIIWSLIILVSFLAIWYSIAHFIVNPSTSFSKVFITYPSSTSQQEIRMNGAYQLVCSNKSRRCSAFHIFFIGKVVFEDNDFWTSTLVIKTGSRRRALKLHGSASYDISSDDLTRREPFTITNTNNQTATVETS